MALTQSKTVEQSQRIDVQLDTKGFEQQVKIRMENYDPSLGWYTAGVLTLPLHQLPLLQQAIDEMRNRPLDEDDKIIPFPLAASRLAE
jgi:hypothetical protein